MNNNKYYLATKRGLFYYTLWENSNFLGNNPKNWYLFSKDRAAVFTSFEEAVLHKDNLIKRISKQGKDYIETHLKKHASLVNTIPEHEVKIKKVLSTFNKLLVVENKFN